MPARKAFMIGCRVRCRKTGEYGVVVGRKIRQNTIMVDYPNAYGFMTRTDIYPRKTAWRYIEHATVEGVAGLLPDVSEPSRT